MSMPLGMTCKKCGKVLGVIISPPLDKLIPLKFVAVCEPCAAAAAREKGVQLNTDEGWDAAVGDLKQ